MFVKTFENSLKSMKGISCRFITSRSVKSYQSLEQFKINTVEFNSHILYSNYSQVRYLSNKPRFTPDSQEVSEFLTKASTTVTTTMKSAFTKAKGTLLEILAKRLPQNEKEFLAERWGYSRLPSESISLPSKSVTQPVKETLVPVVPSSPPPARVEPQVIKVIETPKPIEHPIFGVLIADLGYKKVYLTNVYTLAHAPVWEKNRILRPERAKKIAHSKIKTGMGHPSLSGVITLYFEKETGKYGIVDGQHRAASLVILASEGHWDETRKNIVVDVFDTNSEQQIADLFKEINSSEPVRLIDMPEEGASDEMRAMLVEVTDTMSQKYPEMFKSSARCRPPHLNVDNLRDDLFQNDYLKRHKLKTSTELINHLEKVNDGLSKLSDKQWLGETEVGGVKYNASETSLKKARANCFYLGLDKSWLSK